MEHEAPIAADLVCLLTRSMDVDRAAEPPWAQQSLGEEQRVEAGGCRHKMEGEEFLQYLPRLNSVPPPPHTNPLFLLSLF